MKRTGAPWTLQEMEEARQLYVAGMTYDQVGRKLGRTGKAVNIQLAKHGGPWVYRPGRPRSPEVQARYRRAYCLHADGLSWAKVAARAGMSSGATAATAARLYAERYDLPWPVRS